jgi:hypothetical protein
LVVKVYGGVPADAVDVTVAPCPRVIGFGLMEQDTYTVGAATVTVTVALLLLLLYVAVTVVVVVEVMVVLAWPLKLPLLCPAGICRLPATGKAELSVERLT